VSSHSQYGQRRPPKLPKINAYEMDYNTGATAAIAEMLLQSQRGHIALLPALPTAWPNGQVKGLCARGGCEADLNRRDGRLSEARIRSRLGNLCRVRAGVDLSVSRNGQRLEVRQVTPGLSEFHTICGAEYVMLPVAHPAACTHRTGESA
jgi:alpha-L-fucosidase 2